MTEILSSFVLSFLVTGIIGIPLIKYLKKLRFGQKILEIGPRWHLSKQYTPTMGGMMFIIGIVAATAAAGAGGIKSGDYRPAAVLLFALSFGAIGFVDDYTKIIKRRNKGLTALQKLMLQIAVAVLFLAVMRNLGYLTPNLFVPFVNKTIPLKWFVYMPFATFIIVGCVNAVNLTDGIDGLAAGVTIPVALFFTAVFLTDDVPSMAKLSAAAAGGLAAFLVFNFNPAKVFMGDTGSLFLGGLVCGFSLAGDMPLILIPVGFVYIMETLSDILQVGYFKLTHGKRIFKMAPLHHHFEMCGWSEKKIVLVFSGITVLLCVLAYYGLSDRYGF